MNYDKLTFGDIMQSKILFYDHEKEHACKEICATLRIDYLPAITGNHYYELVKGKYEMKEIGREKRFDIEDRIFDAVVLRKFEINNHNVLFVFEGNVLQGIVHISDYNQNIVIQAIQDDILIFERHIRQLLILEGHSNQDFIEFVASKSKKDNYWMNKLVIYERRKNTMDEFGTFQLFDLSDLLHFFNKVMGSSAFGFSSTFINGKSFNGINLLSALRNLAMHGKNPVTIETQTGIYSISSLKKLFAKLAYLKSQSYQVLDLLRSNANYIEAIKLDNANKLDIIHTYQPKALWYFIGKES